MAGDERFPHLRLLTPKAFDRRRVVRRPPGPPPRVPATHGARLRDEIAAVRARLDEVDRERPRGVVLTWNLARGDVPIGRVHDAIVAASADAPRQPTPAAKVFMTGSLSKTRQSGGTVQKNVFTWVRGDHGETYRLAVVATAPRPGPPGATQRFAVVVGLAVEDATIDLHAELRARLAAGRVRVRVGTE